jgi:hypothetical protein
MMVASRSRALPVVLLGTLIVGGCVLPPPAGTLDPPRVEVLAADPRAVRYGAEAAQAFEHPEIRDKVRALFGRDWSADGARWLSAPVPAFFSKSSPQMLRIGGTDYIALVGCMAAACATRRALVLVSADGERLLARVDDGGLTHLYAFGPGMITLTPEDRAVVESAWRALEPH